MFIENDQPQIIVPETENPPQNDENSEGAAECRQPSAVTAHGKHIFHSLTVIGQIKGHYCLPAGTKSTKYEQIIPQLIAVEGVARDKGAFDYIKHSRRRC